MVCSSVTRSAAAALLSCILASCGVGGAGGVPSFLATGPITIAPFGQPPVTTSATNRLSIAHGATTSFHVTEDIYTGIYTTTVVTNPASSGCITISPSVGNYVFTVSVSAAATCTYPQTADITFADVEGHSTTLYVQGM